MQIIDRILIKIFSKKVGTDKIGNKYFESYCKDYLGRKKRLVIYKGFSEATKIPSEWYSWLHYLSDFIPNSSNKNIYEWQKAREPNKTGSNNNDKKVISWIKKDNYIKWQPK